MPPEQSSSLILHHYDLSPFSEKVRAMLGFAGLDWQSVITREMPPRPWLEPLAGGYRRIPVAQIGADVFCDTRSISTEIARLANRPELTLENCSQEIQGFVREVDLELFFACILSTIGWKVNLTLLRQFSLPDLFRFVRDRAQMGKTSKVRRFSPATARKMVQDHLRRLETMLANQPWLFGTEPCIADFSAYHGLWFIRDVAQRKDIDAYPRVNAWMDRIQAFGHGQRTEIRPEQALDTARNASPRSADATRHGTSTGQRVQIAPDDYGRDPVTGTLVTESPTHWVLARESASAGEVHIHFPRQGFVLSR